MTCYFRHLRELLEEAGITVTKDNKMVIDEAVHKVVGVKYKDCPSAWKEVKKRIAENEVTRAVFVQDFKMALSY